MSKDKYSDKMLRCLRKTVKFYWTINILDTQIYILISSYYGKPKRFIKA